MPFNPLGTALLAVGQAGLPVRVIGVTGHQRLPEAARVRAEDDIRTLLIQQTSPVTGMASLAAGADQLFARLVLESGGKLHAVIPARSYETTFKGQTLDTYLRLLARATTITGLDFDQPNETAYNAAGTFIVEHCDLLIAVWDGQPARGLGGTGDVVRRARKINREVLIIWPRGVQRT